MPLTVEALCWEVVYTSCMISKSKRSFIRNVCQYDFIFSHFSTLREFLSQRLFNFRLNAMTEIFLFLSYFYRARIFRRGTLRRQKE